MTVQTALAEVAPVFPDMQNSWYGYRDAVSYLKDKGAIEGYPDGGFHPQATVNRAEFLKLLFRSRGTVEPATGDCFADVRSDAWFAPYVCAAKRRGIVSGYVIGPRRTIFKPEQPIVFAEAIKMALLAYGNEVTAGPPATWYVPYADEIDRLGILASSSYIPWKPLTRERAADLIARFVRHEEDRTVAKLSPGCGKAATSPELTLSIDGVDRSYLFTEADVSDAHTPSPLIIAFHGRTNSNAQVRSYYGLDRAGKNYFVAYPAAISNGKGSFSWGVPGDYAFFDAIVREIGSTHCIDMDRIFVVGHSLGAYFANTLACARGGVVRGSATVGGSSSIKNCTGPTAAMIINNPKDTSSPEAAAETMRDLRVSMNACEATTMPTSPSSLSCVKYAGCTANPVVFCPHTIDKERNGSYYPHLWPEGTGEAMVKFFDSL